MRSPGAIPQFAEELVASRSPDMSRLHTPAMSPRSTQPTVMSRHESGSHHSTLATPAIAQDLRLVATLNVRSHHALIRYLQGPLTARLVLMGSTLAAWPVATMSADCTRAHLLHQGARLMGRTSLVAPASVMAMTLASMVSSHRLADTHHQHLATRMVVVHQASTAAPAPAGHLVDTTTR